MKRFGLPMERLAAAGRTDITTPDTAREALHCDAEWHRSGHSAHSTCPQCNKAGSQGQPDTLHVDPQEALRRAVEIGELATRLRVNRLIAAGMSDFEFEKGARAGLTLMWPLLEAAQATSEAMKVYKHCLWCQRHDEAGTPHSDTCWVLALHAAIEAVL